MRVCGVIAEFNPLHNAHAYVLSKASEIAPDGVVVILSGNFVQRGHPAVMDKWRRTEAALRCGADLVIELPAVFALAPAQRFALGGIALLHSMGVVTDLLFGAETDRLDTLTSVSHILEKEPPEFSGKIKEKLSLGVNYPTARECALKELFPGGGNLLSTPNNILGVEYQRALLRLSSPIRPHIVKRFGSGHHDMETAGAIASATAIRSLLEKQESVESFVPAESMEIIRTAVSSREAPVNAKWFEPILMASLRTKKVSDIAAISEVCEGLENRIMEAAYRVSTLEELVECVKSKRYTQTKIERILWKSLLGITQEFDNGPPEYIRILGMNQTGMKLLSAAKKNAALPLITKPSRLRGNDMFEFDVRTSGIYSLAFPSNRVYRNEYQTSPIVL